MRAYGRGLREKLVAAVEDGMPRAAAAVAFGVSPATVKRWLRLGAALDAGLESLLRARPDATVAEHCAAWAAAGNPPVSPSTMRRAIARAGWTRKKRA